MLFNIDAVCSDFEVLSKPINGKPPIYFDNACMTLRPKVVVDAMNEYYFHHPSCHRRTIHKFGQITTRKYAEGREKVRSFINAYNAGEIIFTRNSTESINLVAYVFPFKRGDVVVTTDMEHNSNLLPWQIAVRNRGIVHKIFSLEKDFSFDLKKFELLLSQGVRLVSLFHVSHITGCSLPVAEIIQLAHKYGALVLLDGAQSLPRMNIDVQSLDVDFFAASFHKMLGPSGMGMLFVKSNLMGQLMPFIVGGETVADVSYESASFLRGAEGFEAGLQNYAGVMGVTAAIDYVQKIGMDRIQEHEYCLNKKASDLLSDLPRVAILGPKEPRLRGSIVNFSVKGMDSGELSMLLDTTNNIMVRSGVHCAHAWYRKKELLPTVRASFYIYNTLQSVDVFIETMRAMVRYF